MLTESERVISLLRLRQDIALATLSVDPVREFVWRVLLTEGGEWSARSIAAYTHLPWSTIRRKCKDMEGAGIIERRPSGYALTDYGRAACEQLVRETLRIALGDQAGYTAELIEKSGKISKVTDAAASVQFRRIPGAKGLTSGSK